MKSKVCATLPRGLNCTGLNGAGTTNGTYTICPSGKVDACSDGDECVQLSPGVIDCKPVPGTVCADRPPGLFCVRSIHCTCIWCSAWRKGLKHTKKKEIDPKISREIVVVVFVIVFVFVFLKKYSRFPFFIC